MLCITMRRGDYVAIGDGIVVQIEYLNNERVHLAIDAPREVPIVRGEVLERGGGQRPACLTQKQARKAGFAAARFHPADEPVGI